MIRTLAWRFALGAALALGLSSGAMAQSYVAPTALWNPACNSGLGGLVGQTYGASVCQLPGAAANFTPAQISCGATPTLIAASRPGRSSITVENTGTTAVYLGGAGVTTTTGYLLPGAVGASDAFNFTGALYCVVATGSQTVTEVELY